MNTLIFPESWKSCSCIVMFLSARCSEYLVLLVFRHAQIFGDNLPNTIPFHVQLNCDHSVNWWSQHNTYLIHSTLTTVLLVEGLLLLESSFTSSWPSWNLLCHSKTYVQHVVIFIYMLKHFKGLWQSFSPTEPKILGSFLCAHN